jgi:hypothetical protein
VSLLACEDAVKRAKAFKKLWTACPTHSHTHTHTHTHSLTHSHTRSLTHARTHIAPGLHTPCAVQLTVVGCWQKETGVSLLACEDAVKRAKAFKKLWTASAELKVDLSRVCHQKLPPALTIRSNRLICETGFFTLWYKLVE